MTTLAAEKPSAGPAQTPSRAKTEPGKRLMSVDALRGFDMFWIIGADSLVHALNRMAESKPTGFLAGQLEHVEWAGFTFYDLIFPLFVFLVGVSLVFSLTKTIETVGRKEALKRIFRRSLLLFAFGIFYNGGFSNPFADVRYVGVLQRIALAYFFAGLLFCCFKPRVLAGICAGLLLGYWAIMAWVPMRDIQLSRRNLATLAEQSGDSETAALFSRRGNSLRSGAPARVAADKMFYSTTERVTGKYEPGYNVANHLDFQYLPGRKYDVFWDPEGWLSTIPAIATCLLGVFAGLLLRTQNYCQKWKLIYLVSFGVGGVLLGWLWHIEFPVIKKIWTSSYVLVAGGYSLLLLGLFYWVVDILKFQKWCQPFVWLGMNAITIYLVSSILSFGRVSERLVGGDIQSFLDEHVTQGFGSLMISLTGLFLAVLFVRFLYKRGIFLRV